MTTAEVEQPRTTLDLYLEAVADEKDAIERKRIYGDELMSELPLGGEAKSDKGGVRFTAGVRRFNGDLARRHLPPELFAAICVPVPDSKLAKNLLAPYPALLAQCQKTTEPSLRLL